MREELTVIFEDLIENINDYSKRYWSLVKKLAACEKERDEERIAREQAERLVEECEEMVERVTNLLKETEEECIVFCFVFFFLKDEHLSKKKFEYIFFNNI